MYWRDRNLNMRTDKIHGLMVLVINTTRAVFLLVDYKFYQKLIESGFNPYGMEESYDRFIAAFANAGYSYAGKYTVNGTCRIDGSNRLGKSKDARWLPTWNISAKWNAKEESFLKEVDWLSYLSLRGLMGLLLVWGLQKIQLQYI